MLDKTAGVIGSQPSSEVVELLTVGEDRRQAHDPPFVRVRAAKQPLDLHLVANLALIEADHVTFVEDEQAHVIEEGRVVLVEAANPDAAIERLSLIWCATM